MKNQFNKNIALEDSHNREVVAGCYGSRGKSSARFLFAERGAYAGKNRKAFKVGFGSLGGNDGKSKRQIS